MIKKTTDLGNIDISTDVIATICGGAATECYGVVGMASQKMMDGFYDLLGKDNYSREFDSCLQFFTNQIAQNVDYINAFEFFYCQICENNCTNTG